MIIFESILFTIKENTIEFILTIGLVLFIALIAVLTESLSKKSLVNSEISRKILHFFASFSAAFSVLIIDNRMLLISIALIAVMVTFFLVKFDLLQSIHKERSKSWGVFFLPVSFLILLFFFFPENKLMIFFPLAILGFSDSIAAIAGTLFSKKFFRLTSDKKSKLGSAAFFFSTFLIIIFSQNVSGLFSLKYFSIQPLFTVLLTAVSISIILTIIEALASQGSDNLFVPLFAAILLFTFNNNPENEFVQNLFLGIVLAGIVSILSFRFKFLTKSGSAATFILAGFIFGFGGWKWSLPIMTFFVLSSLLSKIRKKENKKVETYFEKTGTRDYLQVLANGGFGGLLVIYNQIHYSELNYFIYLASLAAVCADTWATEIGTLKKRNTYNILNLKKIEQGTSGGISFIGTVGALLGSLVIAFSGYFWIDIDPFYYFIVMIIAGVFGSFIDSFLGATIQAQSKCEICFKITEKEIHCGENTTHHHGLKWLNNDAVNFIAGVTSGLMILIILL